MKRALIRLAAIPVALLMVGIADAETYQIDATHSSIDFAIRHLVGRTKGRFAEFSGTIVYDPAAPEAMSINGTIQVNSLDTGNEKRDGHLKSGDFFGAEEFPTITFVSTQVEEKGDKLQVTGTFTMHGVSKQVSLLVQILGTGVHPSNKKQQIGLATEFTVKASDYGVNSWENFSAILGDEVDIEVLIEANAG